MIEDSAIDENNIDRCTANSEFSLIPNEISQHSTMSADATTILIYLLSCKPNWVVKPKNVWKSKNISRDRVYKAFDELIDLGYMQKIVTKLGNLKSSVRYRVAYFKKFLRRPDFQDTESRDTESQDALIKKISLKEDLKKNNNKPPSVAAQAVVVFSIFNELGISEELKIRMSSQMNEEKAIKLVQRVKRWKSRESDAKACNAILVAWEAWEDKTPKEEVFEENNKWAKDRLKNFDSKMVGLYQCMILSKYVEFSAGGNTKAKIFMYENASFQGEIRDFMNKNLNSASS